MSGKKINLLNRPQSPQEVRLDSWTHMIHLFIKNKYNKVQIRKIKMICLT